MNKRLFLPIHVAMMIDELAD